MVQPEAEASGGSQRYRVQFWAGPWERSSFMSCLCPGHLAKATVPLVSNSGLAVYIRPQPKRVPARKIASTLFFGMGVGLGCGTIPCTLPS